MSQKQAYLSLGDIVVLTLILFGVMIYASTLQFLSLQDQTTTIEQNLAFSDEQNYTAFGQQLCLLAIAAGYLHLRKFDFRHWCLSPSIQGVGIGIGFFLLWSLLIDGYLLAVYSFTDTLYPSAFGTFLGEIRFSTILYAILNGFYEEIFFLGICLAVKPIYLKWAVGYSLLIRVSFHTYQGLTTALGLGILLGGVIYLLYRRSNSKNLFPFWVAHSLADVFGLSVLSYV